MLTRQANFRQPRLSPFVLDLGIWSLCARQGCSPESPRATGSRPNSGLIFIIFFLDLRDGIVSSRDFGRLAAAANGNKSKKLCLLAAAASQLKSCSRAWENYIPPTLRAPSHRWHHRKQRVCKDMGARRREDSTCYVVPTKPLEHCEKREGLYTPNVFFAYPQLNCIYFTCGVSATCNVASRLIFRGRASQLGKLAQKSCSKNPSCKVVGGPKNP